MLHPGSNLQTKRYTTSEIYVEDDAAFAVERVEIIGKATANQRAVASLAAELTTVTPGVAHQVKVAIASPLPQGINQIDATVRVHTNSQQYPTVDIPLGLTVTREINYAPAEVVLITQDKEARPVTRYLVLSKGNVDRTAISTDGDSKFEITAVEPPDESIGVKILPAGKRGYRIQLSNLVANPELAGKELVIHTNVEAMPVIKIPFRIETIGVDSQAKTATERSPKAPESGVPSL